MTDKAAELYPSLAGAADRDRLLADAGKLYAWLRGHEFATEERLRARAAADGIDVDRVNGALAFLRETGRVIDVPDVPAVRGLALNVADDLEEWNLDELVVLAKRLHVPNYSTLNKPDLIAAIRATGIVTEPAVAAVDAPPEPPPAVAG